jgi:hypothetical protein
LSTCASVKTASGIAGLRDLAPADIPAIVEYWLASPAEFLEAMGVDRRALGGAREIRRRFTRAIPNGDAQQSSMAFAITLEARLVGYTLLNRYAEDVNYSHWHVLEPGLRAKGLSTALYPYRVQAYFDAAPISRLIHQTRTSNVGVNRMLDKFVPISRTEYVAKPDGVAAPGEFHIRFVGRGDLPRIFGRARELHER